MADHYPGNPLRIECNCRWVDFRDKWPEPGNIVQQYLGQAVLEQENPPDWAFPTARWKDDSSIEKSSTHWRYIEWPEYRP